MEVVDIDLGDLPVNDDIKEVSSSSLGGSGGGIELLMNEKKKSSSNSTKIDIDDLNKLENELNDLSSSANVTEPVNEQKNVSFGGFGDMFNFSKKTPNNGDISLGQATKDTSNSNTQSTWDGFSKIGEEIPKVEKQSTYMTEREKRRKKRLMIKKLEEWAEKGTYKNGSVFNMDSDYDEVEDEYEGALEEKRKKDSIKLQGWWFTTVVSTLEYGNAFINPFDLNLDGWSEQVSEDLDSYDEIFGELHEKYKGGKMAPEVSLLLRLGFSAAVVNMSNKMLSSATPGVNDVIKQSPELMKMFTNAAVDTMSKQNSAFDFAKTMLNPPDEVNTNFGPPPAPVETKNQTPPQRPGQMQFTSHPGNRPDLERAKNTPMFREQGVDLNNQNINNYERQPIQQPLQQPAQRPEMKGPQISPEISNILSGLKPKSESQQFDNTTTTQVETVATNSVISVSSLKDLDNVSLPKKSKRRHNNSNRNNTVSLDI
jgi:hypothetical protein